MNSILVLFPWKPCNPKKPCDTQNHTISTTPLVLRELNWAHMVVEGTKWKKKIYLGWLCQCSSYVTYVTCKYKFMYVDFYSLRSKISATIFILTIFLAWSVDINQCFSWSICFPIHTYHQLPKLLWDKCCSEELHRNLSLVYLKQQDWTSMLCRNFYKISPWGMSRIFDEIEKAHCGQLNYQANPWC